jgi:hypothetical protein
MTVERHQRLSFESQRSDISDGSNGVLTLLRRNIQSLLLQASIRLASRCSTVELSAHPSRNTLIHSSNHR